MFSENNNLYAKANQKSKFLRDVLIAEGFYPEEHRPRGFCFRLPIRVPGHPEVWWLSISSVKVVEWKEESEVIETALAGEDRSLIYVSELGYSNICCLHENKDALIEHIKLLREGKTGECEESEESEESDDE